MITPTAAGFQRYQNVTNHNPPYKLLRSSSPNYNGSDDKSQHFNADSIPFLHQEDIGHIICLNSDVNSSNVIERALKAANPVIEFTHLAVTDFTAPTLAQLRLGYSQYAKFKKPTLVWCGYGHGRTGTMITALQWQIENARGTHPTFTHAQYTANYVEQDHNGKSTGQFEVLDRLQKGEKDELFQEATVSTVDD